MCNTIIIRQLGLQNYKKILYDMNNFINKRINNKSYISDEIWLLQHPNIFTKGRSSKDKDLIQPGNIPVVNTDRGGQITFHGPGQQIMYILLDLNRYRIKLIHLIIILEKTVIDTLSQFNISSFSFRNLPGIYVKKNKICSIALRMRKGYVFHGLSLNVSMDLSPFLCINPCGDVNIRMTQISNFYPNVKIDDVSKILTKEFLKNFSLINNLLGGELSLISKIII